MSKLNDSWWASSMPIGKSLECPFDPIPLPTTEAGGHVSPFDWPPEFVARRVWPWTVYMQSDVQSHYGYCRACQSLTWIKCESVGSDKGQQYHKSHAEPVQLNPMTLKVHDVIALRITPRPDVKGILELASSYLGEINSCTDDDWACYNLLWHLRDALLPHDEVYLETLIKFTYLFHKKYRGSTPLAPPFTLKNNISQALPLNEASRYIYRAQEALANLDYEVRDSEFRNIMHAWISAIERQRKQLRLGGA